jgi:hypothetical protein
MPAEPLQILMQISMILDSLRISYLTGGSIASSIYGVPRATQDIDLVIDLPQGKVQSFVIALQPDFYIDSDAVANAVETGSSFNAIHYKTVQKIDFFIRGKDEYAAEEMRRRLKIAIDESEQQTVFIASPEDIILQKLLWFKMRSGTSERQWNDALGVIKVQIAILDREYLAR